MSPNKVFTFLLFSFFACFLLSVCFSMDVNKRFSKRLLKPCAKPHHLVLVHGYGAGAWSWFRILSFAELSGYNVTAVDLRGSGTDLTESSAVRNFDEYNKPLVDFFARLPRDEQVILVGHSAGGLSLTDICQKFSKKVKVAVYVAATMLKHGFMTKQDLLDGSPPSTWADKNVANASKPKQQVNSASPKLGPYMVIQEDFALSELLSRPVPLNVLLEAQFKGKEAENVPRVYIKTQFDSVLLPEQQDKMIKRWPPAQVFTVASDHAVLSTHPFVLFGLLVEIAESSN